MRTIPQRYLCGGFDLRYRTRILSAKAGCDAISPLEDILSDCPRNFYRIYRHNRGGREQCIYYSGRNYYVQYQSSVRNPFGDLSHKMVVAKKIALVAGGGTPLASFFFWVFKYCVFCQIVCNLF